MGWFNDLPIGRKLWLGSGSLLLAIATMALVAFQTQQATQTTLDRLVDEDALRMRYAYNVQANVLRVTRNVRDLMLGGTAAERESLLTVRDGLMQRGSESVKVLMPLLERKEVASELEGAWRDYQRVYRERVFPLIEQGQMDAARIATRTQLLPHALKLEELADGIVTYNVERMETDKQAALVQGETALRTLFLVFALSALIGLGLAWLITRTIGRSMAQLVDGVALVAEGDLTVRLQAMSRDELGQLTEHFGRMTESLRTLVASIHTTCQEVAAATEEMSSAMGEAAQATQQVTETIAQLAEGSSQQAEVVTAGAQESRAMNRAAERVSSGALQAASATTVMASSADAGQTALATAVEKMERLHQTVTDSARTVQELGDLSDQIGQIIGMIQGIAAQTNLLALNAAIEAARAGEHGRGFAVVADEVRKLAADSAGSAQQITTMIDRVQAETRQAVDAMERGQHEADETMQLIGQASDSIVQIVDSARATHTEVTAISTAITDLAGGLERVAAGMEEISAVAEENAAATEEVSAAAEEQTASIEEVAASAQSLSVMAADLQTLVASFRTGSEAAVPARGRIRALPTASRELVRS